MKSESNIDNYKRDYSYPINDFRVGHLVTGNSSQKWLDTNKIYRIMELDNSYSNQVFYVEEFDDPGGKQVLINGIYLVKLDYQDKKLSIEEYQRKLRDENLRKWFRGE